MNSPYLHNMERQQMPSKTTRAHKISRASIINFLADAVENGLLKMNTTTGKGGYWGIYRPRYSEDGTKEVIKKVFKERLDSL